MTKNRNLYFLLVNLILGFAVILSYIWGLVYYPEYGTALWGNIETSYIPYIIFSMLLAALGYFVFSFYFINYKKFQTLNASEYIYILSLYIVILFFSALWMPLSIGFIDTNNNESMINRYRFADMNALKTKDMQPIKNRTELLWVQLLV